MKEEYEKARWLAWRLTLPHYKRGRAPQTVKAYYLFPWERSDEEEAAERFKESGGMTKEQAAGLDKLFEKRKQDEQDR